MTKTVRKTKAKVTALRKVVAKQPQLKVDVDLATRKLAARAKKLHDSLRTAEHTEDQARMNAAARRLELGELLLKARPTWPERGPNAKGWGNFLRLAGIDEDVALVAMKYAERLRDIPVTPGKLPTLAEVGLEKQRKLEAASTDVDRDTWCTPKWIADVIGAWDIDPCSNERSHIQAKRAIALPQDGLLELAVSTDRVFVNPPYSDVMPWVQRYKRTRFCFLVKFDPSTKWCAELLAATELVLFPKRTRIEFEPPPGIPGDGGNQFPHGLFFARAEDATPEIREACFEFVHRKAVAPQTHQHDPYGVAAHKKGDTDGEEDEEGAGNEAGNAEDRQAQAAQAAGGGDVAQVDPRARQGG